MFLEISEDLQPLFKDVRRFPKSDIKNYIAFENIFVINYFLLFFLYQVLCTHVENFKCSCPEVWKGVYYVFNCLSHLVKCFLIILFFIVF